MAGVFGHHVELEIDLVPWTAPTEVGAGECLRDNGDGKAVLVRVDYGERDAIDGDRDFFNDQVRDLRRVTPPEESKVTLSFDRL